MSLCVKDTRWVWGVPPNTGLHINNGVIRTRTPSYVPDTHYDTSVGSPKVFHRNHFLKDKSSRSMPWGRVFSKMLLFFFLLKDATCLKMEVL